MRGAEARMTRREVLRPGPEPGSPSAAFGAGISAPNLNSQGSAEYLDSET